jgi:hypothetical protein
MNEKQWDAERRHAQYMVHTLGELRFPQSKSGRRKLRLYAVGCCRLAWPHLTDVKLRKAVEVAERFADERADKAELTRTYERSLWQDSDDLYPGRSRWREQTAASMAIATAGASAYNAAFCMTAYLPSPVAAGKSANGERVLCDLLRCVFGNPFRKPVFPKAWRTEDVTALAAATYDQRAFDRLPILADALEEAGCDDPTMLTHLRGNGPHCRGCWVVDLALGK